MTRTRSWRRRTTSEVDQVRAARRQLARLLNEARELTEEITETIARET